MPALLHALLPILFLLFSYASPSKADLFHYNNVVPGIAAVQMGGAFTALSNDPSGLAYNPAGIAYIKDNEVSGSVQALYTTAETYKKTIGDQDFKETAGGDFSPFLGSVFNTDKYVKNSAAGFSIYDIDSLNKKQNTRIDDQPFGPYTMHRYYRTVNATAATSVKAGGFAKHWNTFALGCALGLLTVEEVYQSYQNAEILRIDSGLTYNNVNQESYFQKISMNGLLSTVGVLFKPTSDISVGASLQHTLIMKEEITMDINTTKLLLDGKQEVVVNSDGHTSMQRGGDSRSSKVLIKRFPLALRLGAAVKPIPRLSLAGDLNYHFPVNLNSAEYNHVAVLNVHCGLDFLLLPQIHLRSGYFTNKDSRPRLVENKPNQLDHVDYQGTTLFGEYSMDKSRYGIGVIYQWGKGQGQKIQSSDGGPAPLQEIVGNRMAYTITISHMVGSS